MPQSVRNSLEGNHVEIDVDRQGLIGWVGADLQPSWEAPRCDIQVQDFLAL